MRKTELLILSSLIQCIVSNFTWLKTNFEQMQFKYKYVHNWSVLCGFNIAEKVNILNQFSIHSFIIIIIIIIHNSNNKPTNNSTEKMFSNSLNGLSQTLNT